jgi:hypothetical protein
MHTIFALALFLSVAQEDSNELYLLDMNWATFSPRWELSFDSSRYGFRTLQGCLDLQRFYIFYEAKVRHSFYKNFLVRYHYFHRDDYSDSTDYHRFEPVLGLGRNFYGHLMIISRTWKSDDELGAGFSWYSNPLNYAEAFFIVRSFDNNFSLKDTRPGPAKDVFVGLHYPYRFTFEMRKEFPRLRFKYYGEYITQAERELQDPNNRQRTFFSSVSTQGRIETLPKEWLGLGTIFSYQGRGARTSYWGSDPTFDSTALDTLRDLMVEPFIDLAMGERWSLNFRYRFTLTEQIGYRRRWDGIISLLEYHVSGITTFGFGYERSFRNYWLGGASTPGYLGRNNIQNRATLLVDFKFPHNAYLWVREGIELDGFPRTTFSLHFHNHTYAALMVTF